MNKFELLQQWIKENKPYGVLCSGGVDSGLLMALCAEVDSECAAITVVSPFLSTWAHTGAVVIAQELHVRHIEVLIDNLKEYVIRGNSALRCYYCKKMMIEAVQKIVPEGRLLCDGTNSDDNPDRPGRSALRELGVRSPFMELGITKEEIRAEAERRKLLFALRPADSCLATRVAHDQELNEKILHNIEDLETIMRESGVSDNRAKVDGDDVMLLCASTYLDLLQACLPRLKSYAKANGLQVVHAGVYSE